MPEFITLAEAASVVRDGMTLALGGMTNYRRPVAFAHALVCRQPRPQNLTLLSFTGGIESDLLIGARCVSIVRSVYMGLESFGFAPMFTSGASAGAFTILEESEQSLALGIRAQMSGVGFIPSRAWLGTDLPSLRPDVKTVQDPYSGETLMAFPAVRSDVAVIHGSAADAQGNVLINNNTGVDLELIYISDFVIATVERRIDALTRTLDGTLIPSKGIDAVVICPRGAFPTSCYPDYPLSGQEFFRYIDACNAGEFERYVDDFAAPNAMRDGPAKADPPTGED